jgi:very-short-patch-repair endonuclease
MPERSQYKPIKLIEVNGLYEDQSNRDEARQVVDILLNHIKLNNGKYPSVGIATFNLYQRNLILEEISRIRQKDLEFDKKISALEPDFFVKNLENIQGDERDIIIISTTFGRKRDGSFGQHFGPIIQKNGYKLLNVIVTRAKIKIYVCTSIPIEYIKQYSVLLQQYRNNGRAIFYTYLAYAKAVSEGDETTRQAILQQLYDNCESKIFEIENDSTGSESPFEDEVYYRLAEKIGQNRIEQQHKVGGFRIDIVIKSKNSGLPVLAIECDGAKYHSSHEAYAWDMFRQTQIETHGFKFYRIWSTNWWISPEKELRKLVEYIHQYDHEESQSIIISPFIADDEEITVVTKTQETKKIVTMDSKVTIKGADGHITQIKFSKTQNLIGIRKGENGLTYIYEKSPLAINLINKLEGEICQLGMLEVYYEIVKID